MSNYFHTQQSPGVIGSRKRERFCKLDCEKNSGSILKKHLLWSKDGENFCFLIPVPVIQWHQDKDHLQLIPQQFWALRPTFHPSILLVRNDVRQGREKKVSRTLQY
jgi:hypothetical protein